MEDIDFSNEFCAFVGAAIPALRAAELLLLLRAHPDRWWEPGAALARLGTTDALAAQVDKLAQAYAERPVTLIRLIYQTPFAARRAGRA